MKTVFITGSSTGIGRETAKYFQNKGWNVIATMRTPEKELELQKLKNIICLKLDVTDIDSIQNAVKVAIQKFGKIDVLVNNAGYGLIGPFETINTEQIKKQFDTNVFGMMETTKAFLPNFRANRDGTIINISSIGGKITFPLYSLYHSTKFAVEGFSEALQFELKPFKIKVKLIEPGPIRTDFFDRSADKPKDLGEYTDYANKVLPKLSGAGSIGLPPLVVAQIIYKAANSNNNTLRYPVGLFVKSVLLIRRLIPDTIFLYSIRKSLG